MEFNETFRHYVWMFECVEGVCHVLFSCLILVY